MWGSACILVVVVQSGGVHGVSDPGRELLETAALCGHLLKRDSVYGLPSFATVCSRTTCSLARFSNHRGYPSVPAEVP